MGGGVRFAGQFQGKRGAVAGAVARAVSAPPSALAATHRYAGKAVAGFTRGESVVEDLREVFCGDADAVVDDGDFDATVVACRAHGDCLSVRSESTHASLALRTRLMRICKTLCLSVVMSDGL